jgi:mycothiol synthase
MSEIADRLLAGYTVRAPTMDEVQAVAAMIIACDVADYGSPDYTVEVLRTDWGRLGFSVVRDAWVVVAPGGQIVGYAEAVSHNAGAEIRGNGYVHPEHSGLGIGTFLIHRIEARARQRIPEAPPDTRMVVTNAAAAVNEPARQLFLQEGYAPLRHFWRMEIVLREPPPAPEWPSGLTLRTFVPRQDDRAVHAAVEDAFQDHWNHAYQAFEAWEQHSIKRESFNPGLWFLALDGEVIAGAALCYMPEDTGWVGQLAVRRPWRRRGLGLALLRHAFGEFYRRGVTTIGLGVDAQNLTGATRLYERAGMRVVRQLDAYEKELRAGRDPLERADEEAAGEPGSA